MGKNGNSNMDPSTKKGHFIMTDKQYFGIFSVYFPVLFFILGFQAVIVTSADNRHRNQDIFPYALKRSQVTKAPI